MCWLPEHAPPRLAKPIIRGNEVDRLVIETLKRAEHIDDPVERSVMRQPQPHWVRDQSGVRYQWLAGQVIEAIGGYMHEGREAVAVHRAIKRLAQQGRIKAYWTSHRRFGWVQLNQQ